MMPDIFYETIGKPGHVLDDDGWERFVEWKFDPFLNDALSIQTLLMEHADMMRVATHLPAFHYKCL